MSEQPGSILIVRSGPVVIGQAAEFDERRVDTQQLDRLVGLAFHATGNAARHTGVESVKAVDQ